MAAHHPHPETSAAELEQQIAAFMNSDSSHHQATLRYLHHLLQQARQREAMPGPSGTHSVQAPSEDLGATPLSHLPKDTTTASRKRRLDVEWREPKRMSGQASPILPTSPILPSYQQTLPMRTVTDTTPTKDPMGSRIVDLTESNPPTPDPFPELAHAYTADDVGDPLERTNTVNPAWMNYENLASFLLEPVAPEHDYGFQQESVPQLETAMDFKKRQVPYFPGPDSSLWTDPETESEEYGEFPLANVEADAIEKLLDNIKDHGKLPAEREATPEIMTCVLKEYQKIGLTWLLKMERDRAEGALLADEMGLGKTVQALALMCANRSVDSLCKTTLIIAPVALMRQWEKEIERHVHASHKFSVYLYHGNKKNVGFSRLRTYDVVLTTFGTLTSEFKKKESRKEAEYIQRELNNPDFRRRPKDKLALLGRECMWYRIIIDEAHNIKNRNTKASKAAADLQSRYRLCMTGTPMMNSIDELYSLIRFLRIAPYSAWSRFNSDIGRPMKHSSPPIRNQAMNRVQILLKSIMCRRLKTSKVDGEEICTIPPKHTETANVKFSDAEQELYKALEAKSQLQMNKFIEKGSVAANYANVLVLLLRLRQACCHPHLIKDLSQPATEGIDEDDLLERARMLDESVINRLREFDSFECPICLEADPNPTIIIPCGHTVCGACVQKLIDPARQEATEEGVGAAKCPQCRGELHSKLITDYKHFCTIHHPETLDRPQVDGEYGSNDESYDSDSDSDSGLSDDDDEIDDKGNLAGFIVSDDEEDTAEDNPDDDEDSDYVARKDSRVAPRAKTQTKAEDKNSKHRTSKGKGKARAKPKKTLAQLKKESLRSKSAKKKYLKRLQKDYIPSAKIDRTIELLRSIAAQDPTEKTLIFSQFTSLLDMVEIPLMQQQVRYQRYDGSMKMDERADAVSAFMDDPAQNVLLVSLKAGNAGLNLWKASQVILLDPFWNPFVEDQAVDRAHRMPQPRPVTVHRVLVPDTIEDRICVLQDKKREIIGAALDEQASKSLTRLNVRELRYLFGMS